MYAALKSLHALLAIVTITGFLLRGFWMITGSPLLDKKLTRIAPHIIDTLFLLSGIAMLVIASMNPLAMPWLLAKFAGLIAYILLGMIALRRGPTPAIRMTAFAAAVAVFAWLYGVALSRSILSWLAVLGA
ncbi:MAG: SirB2 family protein [Woeseiaceae bacterium]|nr:SirB2 family protein [Woeseiaceae bacterium]